jgi:hypothetical protein
MQDSRVSKLLQIALSIVLILVFISKSGSAQNEEQPKHSYRISKLDSMLLSDLPVLTTPSFLKSKELPAYLDNSTQPYMRSLFEQVSLECGQYAGIAMNFNYEINSRRGLPSDVPENQYPTHFTFNFMNGGYGYTGVSYIHSFEIIKTNGQPNVADYGGNSYGGASRWLSGYDKYYNGMKNRIDEVYQIRVGTPEGLITLKNWMENHLEGAEVGGIASFYSSNPWNITTLPEGTPEGGKFVIVEFGPPEHASTIVGWNDSIRYDYNNDGQYTNDIDINGDSVVDMKDWEIGGLLFTQSYNGGYEWADSGMCYMMYKTLADNIYEGGIWNHVVHALKVKEDFGPSLAYKITLKHDRRDEIKVSIGVSSIYSNEPEFTMGFPIFDFQGANLYMQGGYTEEENKTIEFGLDATPLLGMINTGEPAKFYLIVEEDDPNGVGSGEIVGFSLMDYTNGVVETVCPETNVPIQNNDITMVSLMTNVDFDQLKITTSELPHAVIDEAYSHQLEFSGGDGPYQWNIVKHYEETSSWVYMPEINDVQLEPSNNDYGIAMQKIDFEFPFYDKKYDSLYVHVDGFLMFDDQPYPYLYMFDPSLMLRKTRTIAPYLNKYLKLFPDSNDGIWYEGNETYAAFKWKATIDIQNPVEDVVFAVILYPSGRIDYYYGEDNMFSGHIWTVGISDGDDVNYSIVDKNNVADGSRISLIPSIFPEEMALSEDGLFYGTPLKKYTDIPIEFMVEDYNNVRVKKTLQFYSWYLGVENKTVENSSINCFPNPFSGQINFEFYLKEKSKVSIEIRNTSGQQIANIDKGLLSTGKQSIQWNSTNDRGEELPNGVYFVLLKIGDEVYTKKIVLL